MSLQHLTRIKSSIGSPQVGFIAGNVPSKNKLTLTTPYGNCRSFQLQGRLASRDYSQDLLETLNGDEFCPNCL
jgi:hypothetical protein